MPITPTYPGIYIEELPSNSHTITGAPTSITVFIDYSHPFKTISPKTAVQVFSPSDYERNLGGFFNTPSAYADTQFSSLPQAVNQFFLNGGSQAYVVGIPLLSYETTDNNFHTFQAPTLTVGGLTFTAREITGDSTVTADAPLVMTVEVANVSKAGDTADVKITYGAQAEIFRNVNLVTDNKNAAFSNNIKNRIGTELNPVSALVEINSSFALPSTFTAASQHFGPTITVPAGLTFKQFFNPQNFIDVFAQDSDLDKLPIFNLMVLPGVTDNSVLSQALAFCERKRAFVILDPPSNDTADPATNYIGDYVGTVPLSPNGALYFPFLKATDPLTNQVVNLPPSGYVAGIYSKTDQNRGVWKAPAGLETTLLNTSGVVDTGRMNDNRQGTLNPIGVNCLRSFPGSGTVVFGARTLVTADPAFEQWRYVPVRRTALFIEQTLYNNLTWVMFEPNDEPLWVAIRTSIENFMLALYRQGAFQGSTPSLAFQVVCDNTTTTQDDINNGIVNIIVAFAPLKPAEFVIVKIAQLAGQVQA
jgi:phage tail sheath protein FI